MTPYRILIIEDDASIRDVLAITLRWEGYEVLTAENGQVALDLLLNSPQARPQLILLDLMMPVLDGWEFLRIWKRTHEIQAIPVVVISAAGDAKLRNLPSTETLPKPVDADRLLDVVQRLCPAA